jgi:nucleoside-diphosphate-sugar epimerase
MKILKPGGCADGGIFNIGNPRNDLSVRELAQRLVAAVAGHPNFGEKARATQIVDVSSGEYYGEGYQDILTRVPSIRRARQILGWEPKVDLDEALRLTVDFYLSKRPG